APVGFAGGVVVDAGKAERFEPRRGSWAHVSLVVVAVDDHRPLPVELPSRHGVERLERDVDRAGKVFVLVLLRRQNFDQLCRGGGQLLHVLAVDPGQHQSSLSTSPKTTRPASAAAGIVIAPPLISGCSRRQRSAFSAVSKKLRTSQQPQKLGPSQQ